MIALRVGVFHPSIHPRYFGGSVAVTIPIVNELAFSGHEVILFVVDQISQVQLNRIMGDKMSSCMKVMFKPSVFSPRSMLDLYENTFRLFAGANNFHYPSDFSFQKHSPHPKEEEHHPLSSNFLFALRTID